MYISSISILFAMRIKVVTRRGYVVWNGYVYDNMPFTYSTVLADTYRVNTYEFIAGTICSHSSRFVQQEL